MCVLMRSKLFPNSVFSSSSASTSPSSSRATSPDVQQPGRRPSARRPSPALSTTSSKSRTLVRSRSRSLSVSLAQERMERERSITAGPPKKRVLNREISMSRAFKPKTHPSQDEDSKAKAESKKRTVLQAEATKKTIKDEGVLLVEATPTKPKLARSSSSFSFNASKIAAEGTGPRTQSFLIQSPLGTMDMEDDDDEEWRIPGSSSPDILLLGPGRSDHDAQVDDILVDSTPTKRSRLR